MQYFDAGDLTGILSDYAPDAVLFTPNRQHKGIEAIRSLFQTICAEFGQPGATFRMLQQTAVDEFSYIVWTAETADNVYDIGTDTFVVRGGKIVAQSFACKITPKG